MVLAVTGRSWWFGNHVWEVEALFDRVAQNLCVEFLLFRLEVPVSLDALFDHSHVRTNVGVECLDEMRHIVWVVPAFYLLEKAEIGNSHGWCSTNARGAMHKDVQILVIHQVVQMLGRVE